MVDGMGMPLGSLLDCDVEFFTLPAVLIEPLGRIMMKCSNTNCQPAKGSGDTYQEHSCLSLSGKIEVFRISAQLGESDSIRYC